GSDCFSTVTETQPSTECPRRASSRCGRTTLTPTLPTVVGQRGGWRTFGERTVYDNRWVRLGLVDVQAPDGERWEYHVVHLDRIAVALIVDDQDRVLMSWRHWFGTGEAGCGVPGGCGGGGEGGVRRGGRGGGGGGGGGGG